MLKGTSLYLAVSLAVNAVLLGLVGGRLLGERGPAPVEMEFERYGPVSEVVTAAWDQLPEKDRAELGKQLREEWRAMEPERERLQDAGQAVYEAALAHPYDEGRIRDAVVLFQHNEQRLQRRAEDILIGHLGNMPPEARATAAVGLLTPYNARVRRAGSKLAVEAPLRLGEPPPASEDASPTN